MEWLSVGACCAKICPWERGTEQERAPLVKRGDLPHSASFQNDAKGPDGPLGPSDNAKEEKAERPGSLSGTLEKKSPIMKRWESHIFKLRLNGAPELVILQSQDSPRAIARVSFMDEPKAEVTFVPNKLEMEVKCQVQYAHNLSKTLSVAVADTLQIRAPDAETATQWASKLREASNIGAARRARKTLSRQQVHSIRSEDVISP